jgi:hypothetical protein
MRSIVRTILIAIAGLIVGAVVVLSIPAPGDQPVDEERDVDVRTLDARTLLAWTPAKLPDGFATGVRRVDGVKKVAEVRSAIVWLDSWQDDSGRSRRPADGLRIPMEVAAIDAANYDSFVPEADRALLAELDASNGIVLGHRGAALRGISANGSLRFGDVDLDVTGVINDGLIGAHEAVVTLDRAEQLGIVRSRYLLIEIGEGVDHETVGGRVRESSRGAPVRVRAPGETPEFRHGDAVLPIVRLKELFGEFAAATTTGGGLRVDERWKDENIVEGRVPILGNITCHRELFGPLSAAMDEIERRGLGDQIDPGDFGGCFSPRFLSQDEEAGLSHHSWGVAFDINVAENPFGSKATLDERIVDVLERWGFAWGGRWLVPDGMHFEYLRPPLSPKG